MLLHQLAKQKMYVRLTAPLGNLSGHLCLMLVLFAANPCFVCSGGHLVVLVLKLLDLSIQQCHFVLNLLQGGVRRSQLLIGACQLQSLGLHFRHHIIILDNVDGPVT